MSLVTLASLTSSCKFQFRIQSNASTLQSGEPNLRWYQYGHHSRNTKLVHVANYLKNNLMVWLIRCFLNYTSIITCSADDIVFSYLLLYQLPIDLLEIMVGWSYAWKNPQSWLEESNPTSYLDLIGKNLWLYW